MKSIRRMTVGALAMALCGLPMMTADAATTSLSSNRTSGIAGEAIRFGGFVGTKFTRAVVLQRYASGAWRAVTSGRTDRSGRFSLSSTIRGSDTTYRVSATKVKRNGTWYAARNTPNKRIRTQQQASTFVSGERAVVGASSTLTWKFYPPRPNRPTVLQRLDGDTWSTLASGKEAADGYTSFSWKPSSTGTKSLRAVAVVHNGAVQHTSSSHQVDVSEAGHLPSDVLNLTNWKLTLPIGSDDDSDDAIEVKQPELAEFEEAPYFHVNSARTGVVFRAQVGGATTSGSSYPRSELREMTDDGDDEADWDSADGEHVMRVTEAITHVPAKKSHVVAAQIHDDDDDVIMIRLEGKHLFVEADGDDIGTLDSDYQLATPFTVEIRANADGIQVSYNGASKVDYDKHGKHWYFKAGCYTQSNVGKGDDADDFGEVVIYDLTVKHT